MPRYFDSFSNWIAIALWHTQASEYLLSSPIFLGHGLSALPWNIILAFYLARSEKLFCARYPAKLWQYKDWQGGRVKKVGDNRQLGGESHYSGPSWGRVQNHSGEKRVRDISASTSLHHRGSAYLEEEKKKTKTSGQIVCFLEQSSHNPLLFQSHEAKIHPRSENTRVPLWLPQIAHVRSHCARSLSSWHLA